MNEMISMLVRELKGAEQLLERLILETPTGPRRNEICDANIHLKEALHILETAQKLVEGDATVAARQLSRTLRRDK